MFQPPCVGVEKAGTCVVRLTSVLTVPVSVTGVRTV